MIKEMTINNDKTNETHANLEAKKSNDDCIDDDNNFSEVNKAPCFIGLFVIRRIISKYLDSIINNEERHIILKELASMCNDDENGDDIELLVFDILSRLLKDGIKIYVNKRYNEKQRRDII